MSPGDRVRLFIPGIGGDPFNGNYVVSFDGSINLPLVGTLPVVGLGPQQIEQRLSEVLLQKRLFRPELLRVSVQVIELAPIQVTVLGAAFNLGRILLNQAPGATASATPPPPNPDGTMPPPNSPVVPGGYSLTRYLTAALKTAGGVRPNADLKQVQLVRNGQTRTIDLSGILSDQPINDVPLIAGDQIVVPDAKRFQSELVRPTPITPDRIPLYVSNLTSPGSSRTLNDVEYGTRLSQALIAAQCIGGTSSTNARRRAVLVRVDTRTQEAVATQRSVESLIRRSNSAKTDDPYLMPRDGIACYDSTVTNIGSVLNILSNLFTPLGFVRSLFR